MQQINHLFSQLSALAHVPAHQVHIRLRQLFNEQSLGQQVHLNDHLRQTEQDYFPDLGLRLDYDLEQQVSFIRLDLNRQTIHALGLNQDLLDVSKSELIQEYRQEGQPILNLHNSFIGMQDGYGYYFQQHHLRALSLGPLMS